jgi:transcriptional regulator with XRE-family HTH domain
MFNGERLKQLRLEQGLTQIQLAKYLNTTHSTVNRYEKGVHQPDMDTLNRLAEYFNVTTDYLLGRTEERNNSEKVSEALQDDPELQEFWDMLKDREDLQILFKQTKNLDAKEIQQIIRIIKAIEDEEDNE